MTLAAERPTRHRQGRHGASEQAADRAKAAAIVPTDRAKAVAIVRQAGLRPQLSSCLRALGSAVELASRMASLGAQLHEGLRSLERREEHGVHCPRGRAGAYPQHPVLRRHFIASVGSF